MHTILLNDTTNFAGTERHILDLAVALARAGASASIACPAGSALAQRASAAGMPLINISASGPTDTTSIRILAAELHTGAADILHCHNGRTHLLAVAAVRWAGRGVCVATQHFVAPNRLQRRGVRGFVANRVHGHLARHTAWTIAISNAVREGLVRRGDFPAERITVVHNGVPAAEAGTGAAGAGDARGGGGGPVVLCLSRLAPEKDIATLVAAMAQVHAAVPAARLLIAGEGALREELTAQAAQLGVAGVVQFAGFRTDTADLLRQCDLFVLPAPEEPFGLVLLEAMAAGRAVVAMRAGGPMEIVVDGQTGLLATPRDPADLADKLLRLLRDDGLRASMAAAGRERYHAHFTAERMARETVGVYNRAAKQEC